METNKYFIDKFDTIDNIIGFQINNGYCALIELCKVNGGFFPTMQTEDKYPLKAYYEDGFTGEGYDRTIYGFHYDERDGLQICTDDMIDNYEYDTDYSFDTREDCEGEDLEQMEKMLADASYYVSFDDYCLRRHDTIMSILNGINQYL